MTRRLTMMIAAFFTSTILLASNTVCKAVESNAPTKISLIRTDQNSPGSISELVFSTDALFVEAFGADDHSELRVLIRGSLTVDHVSLLSGNQMLVKGTSEEKNFELPVVVRGNQTPIIFVAVQPQGTVRNETVILEIENWEEVKASIIAANPLKRHAFSVAAGLTFLGYKDSEGTDFDSSAMTLKAGYTLNISKNWSVGLNGFFNVFQISSSLADVTARFLGINAKGGYSWSPSGSSWRFSLLAGIYYLTTFVTDNKFGFSNVLGPEIYPTVQRQITPYDSVYGYFKFSPVAPNLNQLTFESRELVFGLGWSHELANKRALLFMMDWSQLTIKFPLIEASGSSLSFSAGYAF